jgi:predicted CXXCH cytochrome family protein
MTYICILLCAAGMAILGGCEAKTRYQVLSFFFDGVPEPGKKATGAGGAGPVAGSAAGAPAQRASQHGPFAAKLCSACHDPNTNALLLPRSQLCLKCHTFAAVRRQHGPVASGGCLVCHDPHRSSNEYLLVSPAREFCTYCHDPAEINTREVHQGNTAACTECHNPHGSDNDYFIR